MHNEPLIRNLQRLDAGVVFFNEPLKNHCTWRIGGPADALVCPRNPEQLQTLRRYIHDHNLAAVTIGQGSNLLFDDAGFRGVVIKIGPAFSDMQIAGDTVRAQTGVSAARLARACQQAGLSGLEHIVGIPGTLGGLIAMNGGSLQQNIGASIRSVTAMDAKGEIHTFQQDDCRFAYRKSMFQDTDWIILQAILKLQYDDPKTLHARMLDILRQRRRKFPRRQPNCGSVFLSTTQMYETIGPPGRVIEEAGLKGCTVGGARVSRQHANFIVNTGCATAEDVCHLVHKIRRTVYRNTGLWLKCEVRKVTPLGDIKPLSDEMFPPRLRDCFIADIQARSGERISGMELYRKFLFNSWYRVSTYYRLAMFLRRQRRPRLLFRFITAVILMRLSRVPGVDFRSKYEIGPGLLMPHPHDIVLGIGCRIGCNVTIYNGVTLGAKNIEAAVESTEALDRYPKIKDGVTIFTGAKILGPVVIGENSIVGANAVVTHSFPENSIIAGIPAKLISKRRSHVVH